MLATPTKTSARTNRLSTLMNNDPLGFEAGDVNLTRYVANSPTNATDPSGLQQSPWIDDWDIQEGVKGGWQYEDGILTTPTPAKPIIEGADLKSAKQYKCAFEMTLEYQFGGGYTEHFKGGKPQPRKLGMFGNSGIKIYNWLEVQIFDTYGMKTFAGGDAKPRKYLGGLRNDSVYEIGGRVNVYALYPGEGPALGWDGDDSNKLISGIPYGVGNVSIFKDDHNEQGPGEWNRMIIKFTPQFAGGKMFSADLVVTLNQQTTFKGTVTNGTSGNKPPISKVEDFHIYIQSHWGSKVNFRNVSIEEIPSQ